MDSPSRITAYTIRYLLSPKEYRKLLSKLSTNVTEILPSPEKLESSASKRGDHIQSIVRSQTRLFAASYSLLAIINAVILKRRGSKLQAVRIASSISAISGIYKVLYGVLTAILQKTSILPQREKYRSRDSVSPSPTQTTNIPISSTNAPSTDKPTLIKLFIQAGHFTKRTLKKTKHLSPLLPSLLSGLVAGSAFALFPQEAQGYAAIYLSTRTIEFIYNFLDDLGYLEFKPRILGSWALFPFAFSQLFYTFIFHPECCPNIFRKIMFKLSEGYIPIRPAGYPIDKPWPNPDQIVEGIATIARSKYPKFVSPILFPNTNTIPSGLESAEPILSLAHPAMTTLTGALTHPNQPSEFRTYTELVLSKYSTLYKYVFIAYVSLGLLKWRRQSKKESKSEGSSHATALPGIFLSSIANTARTTTFIVMTAASSWYGIGLAQQMFNKKFIPVLRFKLIGFLAGLWAFADQVNGRARYMFAVRLALRSHWDIFVKEHNNRLLVKNGATILFSISFALLMAVFDISPKSIPGSNIRKVLNWIKTNKYEDIPEPKPEDL